MATTPPSITPAPTPAPERGDRMTFSGRVDAFVTWLTNAVTEFGAVASNVFINADEAHQSALTAINAPGSNATSASNVTIAGSGDLTFVIQLGKEFIPGMYVVVAVTASPSTNSVWGQIKSYDGVTTGNMVVTVFNSRGSGAFSAWTISLSGGSYTTIETTLSYPGYRNKIYNGNLSVDQINNRASVTPTASQLYVDGWGAKVATTSKLTFGQSTDAPPGFAYSLSATVNTQVASIPAGDVYALYQRIEGNNCIDLQLGLATAQPIAVSFWAKASTAGNYAISLKNSAGNRNYIGIVAVTTAWTRVSVLLTGDVTGTWLTGEGVTGLGLYFNLGCGTTFDGTASAWAAGNFYNTSAGVDLVSLAVGQSLKIAGIMLENAIIASSNPENILPYPLELNRCLRYVEKSYETATVPGSVTNIGCSVVHSGAINVTHFGTRFKQRKAVVPSLIYYNPSTGTANRIRNSSQAIEITVTGISTFAPTSTETIGSPTHSTGDNLGDTMICHWMAKAELPGV